METGSWIIDHGSLPSHELFTYTVSGKTWADQEWGSEVLGDLIFRAGGFLAFSLAYTAVTWVGFWFIWRRIAHGAGPRPDRGRLPRGGGCSPASRSGARGRR